MPTYSADLVFPIDRAPIANGFVKVDDSGMITYIGSERPLGGDVLKLEGALTPGFINTHCHLELSHLKGRVDTGTGLLPFLKAVVTLREVDPAEITAAIQQGDADMWADGIQAVGDISNAPDTGAVKAESPITYYSFVEVFDFLQGGAMAKDVFAKAEQTFAALPEPKRFVPHAPYTVSDELYSLITAANEAGGTVSIHNQETAAEGELFMRKSGGFLDFYKGFGFSLDHFKPFGKTSLAATLPHLDARRRNLFVHNTMTSAEDVQLARAWSDQVYWATCPNANLYIENRLPDYSMFMSNDGKMTIGTDSLTSNWQLSIVEEMKTIQRYQRYVDTPTLLQWATLNGAQALGLDDQLGSLTPGKRPGLIQLKGFDEQGRFVPETTSTRVV